MNEKNGNSKKDVKNLSKITENINAEETEESAKSKTPRKPLSRKKKRSIVSLFVTFCVIAAVVLVNIIASVLTSKFSALTADITSTNNFDVTDQSMEIVSKMKKKVGITFLTNRTAYEALDTYCKQTSVLASQLAQNSNGMISVDYVDLVQNPTYADKYDGEQLSTTDVIVSCGDKYKILTKNDLFNFEQYSETYQYISSSKSEQAIDNAIVTVTSDVSTKVALITDNCGSDYSYFKNTLVSNNYDVQEISIENGSLAEDVETVIVYAPSKDFTESAVEKLEKYLINNDKYGKNMIYIPYERHADTPNIDGLLSDFGMKLDDGLAFDMDTSMLMANSYYEGIACSYASDLYKDNIDKDDYPVLVGLARPIEITNEKTAVPLLTLSQESSGYSPFDAQEGKWSMTDAVTGNVCVMAQGVLGSDKGVSTLVVAGSHNMFIKAYLGSDFSNAEYIFNMLASLNGRDTSIITVTERVITDYDISLSQNAAFWIGFIVFALIPVLVLGAGLAVYLVRRNR